MQDKIKEAFQKIREDISFLYQEILDIKKEIQELKEYFSYATEVRHSADKSGSYSGNYQGDRPYFDSSIGNIGVPSVSQQTLGSHSAHLKRTSEALETSDEESQINMNAVDKSSFIFDKNIKNLLADMKNDLKSKFQSLTKQEFLVFSVLYVLEEEMKNVSYKELAQRTGLTESSVRDYISRIIRKGIPIVKNKVNNRQILVKIPSELREIATLDSLSKLKRFDDISSV